LPPPVFTSHQDENLSGQPFRLVRVEIKQAQ
jgi:hypothetical protein